MNYNFLFFFSMYNLLEIRAAPSLTSKQKNEYVAEVGRQYHKEFYEDPPMRFTVNRIKGKFEMNCAGCS